ncbi:MAG: rhomboid family intramembrane serine protease [Bradymonadia bacterium]
MLPLRSSIKAERALITRTLCGFLALCACASFLLELNHAMLYRAFGFIPARLTSPSAWQLLGPIHQLSSLFTYTFVHESWLHAGLNILFLWVFASPVETKLGGRSYVVFLTFIVLGCALCDTLARPASVIPLIGASGLVSGVMGIYIVTYPNSKLLILLPVAVPYPVKLGARWFVLVWLSLQIATAFNKQFDTILVAWWIHLVGFFLGGLYGWRQLRSIGRTEAAAQRRGDL